MSLLSAQSHYQIPISSQILEIINNYVQIDKYMYYLSSCGQNNYKKMDQQKSVFQKQEFNKTAIKLLQNSKNQRVQNNATTIRLNENLRGLLQVRTPSYFFLNRLSEDVLIQQDRRDLVDPNNFQRISAYNSFICTIKSFRKKTQSYFNILNKFIQASYDLQQAIQNFDDYLIEQEDDLSKNAHLYSNRRIKIASQINQAENENLKPAFKLARALDLEQKTLEKLEEYNNYVTMIHMTNLPLVEKLIDDFETKRLLLMKFISIKLELMQKRKDLQSKEINHDVLIAETEQLVKKRQTNNDELKAINDFLCKQTKQQIENLQMLYDVKKLCKSQIGKFVKYRKIVRSGPRITEND